MGSSAEPDGKPVRDSASFGNANRCDGPPGALSCAGGTEDVFDRRDAAMASLVKTPSFSESAPASLPSR